MKCDHPMPLGSVCTNSVARAPRVVVPSTKPFFPEHRPLRMFTSMHFCEIHKGDVNVEDLLSARVRRDFEMAARKKRPLGFKCDFEKASIEYVLVTTPEYRQFLQSLGRGGIMRAALGVTRLAG